MANGQGARVEDNLDEEPMRNLSDVIDRMLAIIPATRADEIELREALERVKGNAGFRPPEMENISWTEGMNALFDFFGDADPTSEWGKQVQAIWMDRA
jgi:hypothetical protein